ncbi:MAG: DNA-processing protein DprA [Clostridia bacterium]|nr:DNA-processing protein DprA [Clostridia bacterium]
MQNKPIEDDLSCVLHLSLALMYSGHQKSVIDHFKTVKEFFLVGEDEWKNSGLFTKKQIERIKNIESDKIKKIIEQCKKDKIEIISYDSEFYPKELLETENFPLILYTKGKKKTLLNENKFAIVGSRHPTSHYGKATREFAKALSVNGMTIVSGGAMGVDSIAHQSALEVGANTICILGSGLSYPFRTTFRKLADKIQNSGILISEFPPKMPAYKYNFPIRNRIISGISKATLITQAGLKSGSLITAKYALEQGKDVYVTPAPIFREEFYGSNKLIKDGAIPVMEPFDILCEYGLSQREFSEKVQSLQMAETKKAPSSDFDKETLAVYDKIGKDEISFEDLIEKVNLTAGQLMTILTELEITEYIKTTQTGKYIYS